MPFIEITTAALIASLSLTGSAFADVADGHQTAPLAAEACVDVDEALDTLIGAAQFEEAIVLDGAQFDVEFE